MDNSPYWKPPPEEEVQTMPPPSGGAIIPDAASYPSVCTPFTVAMYPGIYNIPPEFSLCAPTINQRVHAPPPGYAAIYTQHFQNGLSLPLPEFVVSVLAYYRIALAQLHPNSIFSLLGFMGVCKQESFIPTVTLFRHFFRLQSPEVFTGWYTFQSRGAKGSCGEDWCLEGWMSSFLFFKKPENLTLDWNYSPIVDTAISESEREQVRRVLAKRKRVECEEEERMISMASVTRSRMIKADASFQTTVSDHSESKEVGERMAGAFVLKPCSSAKKAASEMLLEKSSKKSEPTVLSTACILNTMAEIPSTEECVDVPNLDGLTPEQYAWFIFLLQRDKEELEQAMMLDAKEKDDIISLLQGDKKKLAKVVAALEHSAKAKDKEIARLTSENSRLQEHLLHMKSADNESLSQVFHRLTKACQEDKLP